MRWLDKLRHHEDHAQWLSEHPDKDVFHASSAAQQDTAEQQQVRERMEREIAEAARRTRAGNAGGPGAPGDAAHKV